MDDITLPEHEAKSEARYGDVMAKLNELKERKMEGINSDKVNINLGGGEGGTGGAGLAAVIAALGNRNEGGDTAGLIAALGNRNNDGGMAAMLPALMAGQNNGLNNIWPIILLALLGRGGRGGLFGGGDDCGPVVSPGGVSPALAALLQTLTEGQGQLRADVPRVALETQAALQQSLAQLALGTQQGFANTGDKVTNTGTALLAAIANSKDTTQNGFALVARDLCDVKSTVMAEGCATRELVQAGTTAVLSRIDRAEIDELRDSRNRFERQIEVNSLRSQVEVNQTVNTTTNQAQAQQQQQLQFQDINNRLGRLFDRVDIVHQEARATNSNVIAGNTGAVTTGAQTSTPTNVNA